MTESQEKSCSQCGISKAISEFTMRKRARDGRAYICKACNGINTRPYDRERWLKRTYGITLDEYDGLFREQDGRCAICRTDRTSRWGTLCVDHDHKTGRIRGLLCTNCNQALGKFGDCGDRLKDAIRYLEKA